jgi:hypothetical protein
VCLLWCAWAGLEAEAASNAGLGVVQGFAVGCGCMGPVVTGWCQFGGLPPSTLRLSSQGLLARIRAIVTQARCARKGAATPDALYHNFLHACIHACLLRQVGQHWPRERRLRRVLPCRDAVRLNPCCCSFRAACSGRLVQVLRPLSG